MISVYEKQSKEEIVVNQRQSDERASIVLDYTHPFMDTALHYVCSIFPEHNAPCQKIKLVQE